MASKRKKPKPSASDYFGALKDVFVVNPKNSPGVTLGRAAYDYLSNATPQSIAQDVRSGVQDAKNWAVRESRQLQKAPIGRTLQLMKSGYVDPLLEPFRVFQQSAEARAGGDEGTAQRLAAAVPLAVFSAVNPELRGAGKLATRAAERGALSAAEKAPSLLSAVRVKGKTYTGPTHLDALAKIPDPEVRKAASLDANSRGFVNERGKYMDRYKAADYARAFDLFSPDAPDWARTAPEVISENLKLPEMPSQGGLSAAERAANLRAAKPLLDEKGAPLVLYHGTQNDVSAFDPAKIQTRFPYSFGFHMTDNPREASGYADSIQNMVAHFNPKSRYGREVEEGANVMPLHAFPQNPLVIDTPNISASSEADLNRYDIMRRIVESRETDNPYDSVIIRRKRGDGYDHMNVIMLDPSRIKSAIGNRGTFDLTDPDLNKAKGGFAVKR